MRRRKRWADGKIAHVCENADDIRRPSEHARRESRFFHRNILYGRNGGWKRTVCIVVLFTLTLGFRPAGLRRRDAPQAEKRASMLGDYLASPRKVLAILHPGYVYARLVFTPSIIVINFVKLSITAGSHGHPSKKYSSGLRETYASTNTIVLNFMRVVCVNFYILYIYFSEMILRRKLREIQNMASFILASNK